MSDRIVMCPQSELEIVIRRVVQEENAKKPRKIVPDIMTTDDIGDYLRIGRDKAQHLCATGRITAAKIGNEWRASRLDVDAYFESHKIRGRK